MKHRPPNPDRTTMRMRLVDGTPKPFGEVEFGALERPSQVGLSASMPRGGKEAPNTVCLLAHVACKRCGFHQCACKSGDYDARRKVVTGEHPARLVMLDEVTTFTVQDSEKLREAIAKMPPGKVVSISTTPPEKPVDVNYGLGCPEPTVKPAEQPPEQRWVQVGDVFVWKTSKQHYTVRAVIADQIYWQGFSDLVCTPLCLIDTVATRIIPTPEPITPAPQPQSGRLENCTIEGTWEWAKAQMMAGNNMRHGCDALRVRGDTVEHSFDRTHWIRTYIGDVNSKDWSRCAYATGWTVEALP